MLRKRFDWLIFGPLPYEHLFRSRARALVEELRKKGFFLYYLDFPPASFFQYFKDRISYKGGLLNFLFPKMRNLPGLTNLPQPPIFPALRYETDLTRKVYQSFLTRRILKLFSPIARRRNRPVIGFLSLPWWFEIAAKIDRVLGFHLLIYDCADDIRVFCNERQFPYYYRLHKCLIEKADLILISAERLRKDIARIRPDAPIKYLPNGVDFDFFVKNGLNASPPPDLEKLPRPIIGFVGALFPWIDINLIVSTAQSFPKASIVLIGLTHGIKIPSLSNLHLLGPRPYLVIPAYINNFDVCLIPFVAGSIADKVDPLKVYEYLTLGKPVVACHLPELEKMRDLIYLTDNEKDFIDGIRMALAEKDEGLKEKRMEYARENSWGMRVEKLLAIIEDKLR
uniref:Glycosyltransferase n=1 Tax=candidate division WOR-3 bacterium TaxID=2052148 RepID=A0A7C3UPM7_UNCW3